MTAGSLQFERWVQRRAENLLHVMRRTDPYYRPAFNRLLREPIAGAVQALINWRRPNEGLYEIQAIDPALGHAGPALKYLADFDGPRERHREEIARNAAAEIEGSKSWWTPSRPRSRAAAGGCRTTSIPDATYYVNTIGRAVRQIGAAEREHCARRSRISSTATDKQSQEPGKNALRAQIQDYVPRRAFAPVGARSR